MGQVANDFLRRNFSVNLEDENTTNTGGKLAVFLPHSISGCSQDHSMRSIDVLIVLTVVQ